MQFLFFFIFLFLGVGPFPPFWIYNTAFITGYLGKTVKATWCEVLRVCGVVQSWCPGNPDCDDPALLCGDLVSDYHAARRLTKEYPDRYK
jgi:hypothetical protein